MKSESYQQYAIVAADSAQELTDKLNAKLIELKAKSPKVTFEGMIARISYLETVYIPENVSDEFSKAGIDLTCQDCPFFEPQLRPDGQEDRRAKKGGCPFAQYEVTRRDAKACEKLFKMINSGEVRLCLAESEE